MLIISYLLNSDVGEWKRAPPPSSSDLVGHDGGGDGDDEENDAPKEAV